MTKGRTRTILVFVIVSLFRDLLSSLFSSNWAVKVSRLSLISFTSLLVCSNESLMLPENLIANEVKTVFVFSKVKNHKEKIPKFEAGRIKTDDVRSLFSEKIIETLLPSISSSLSLMLSSSFFHCFISSR